MKVYFHSDFYDEYTSDPAAANGRMEAIVEEVTPFAEIIPCMPAAERDLLAAHSKGHIEQVRRLGLYEIAALAAGGAIQAAKTGMEEPGFDHHVNDWGGLLYTEDYKTMGGWVCETARRNGGGCYGILEGGYNHNVLGKNVLAFLEGLQKGQ